MDGVRHHVMRRQLFHCAHILAYDERCGRSPHDTHSLLRGSQEREKNVLSKAKERERELRRKEVEKVKKFNAESQFLSSQRGQFDIKAIKKSEGANMGRTMGQHMGTPMWRLWGGHGRPGLA